MSDSNFQKYCDTIYDPIAAGSIDGKELLWVNSKILKGFFLFRQRHRASRSSSHPSSTLTVQAQL